MTRSPVTVAGPWIYTDPEDRRHIVDLVPLEHDPTLDEARQPRALYLQSDNGWISVTPVGHDFSLEELSEEQLFRLFAFLTDQGRPECWKLIHRDRGLFVDSDGQMYRVRVSPGRSPEQGDTRARDAREGRRSAVVFERLDGEWRGFTPIDHPVTLESLSSHDLSTLLRRAIGWA